MKNSKIYLIAFFVVTFISVVYFVGCKQNSSEPETSSKPSFLLKGKVKNIASFEEYGKFYNAFLSNAYYNFSPDKKIINKSEKIDFLAKMHKEYNKKLKHSNEFKKYISDELDEYKIYHDRQEILPAFDRIILSDINKRKTQKLFKSSALAQYEQDALDNLCVASYNACSGVISISEYSNVVDQIAHSYDEYYSATAVEEDAGNLLGICVAITQASIEWWEQNPDAVLEDQIVDLHKSTNKYRVMALPGWIAADACGALLGGLSSYMGQSLRSPHSQVNWSGAAVAGAVSQSTGIVGKAYKWLSSWF